MQQSSNGSHSGVQFVQALWDEAAAYNKSAFWLLFTTVIVTLVGEILNWPAYEANEPFFFAAIWALFVVMVAGPMYRLFRGDTTTLVHGVIWSLISLAATLVVFALIYLAWTSNFAETLLDAGDAASHRQALQEVRSEWSIVLVFPAVLLGVWSALTALVVRYRVSQKHQRTANAFNLLVLTMTNPTYAEKAVAKQALYPAGTLIPLTDRGYFVTSRLAELPDLQRKCDEARAIAEQLRITLESKSDVPTSCSHAAAVGSAVGQQTLPNPEAALQARVVHYDSEAEKAANEHTKITAIAGLRYLLNFYEFMAKGIRAKDLDEDLLFGTLRSIVVALYNDSAEYRKFVREGNNTSALPDRGPVKVGQKAAFSHLAWLVEGDNDRKGWASRDPQ